MTTSYIGVRIADMPDLGLVTDNSSFVGEHAGSGRFSALALRDYTIAGISGGGGGTGLPDAPTDGQYYGRSSGTWQPVGPLNSPAFTGTPSAPTAAPGNSSSQIATTAFVLAALASLSAQLADLTARVAAIEPFYIRTD